jgi:aminoglycoside phosphotransferase (APT) family kinase protein
MSLIVEVATDGTKLAEYSYRVLIQNARLVVPLVLFLALGAPYILRLFGDSYSNEGATLLRLMALAALPNIVTSVYISCVRVQRRVLQLFLIFASMSSLVLSLSYILLGLYGINGIGIAWLLSETVIATVLLFTRQGRVWLSHLNMNIVLRLTGILRSLGWRWASRRRLGHVSKLVPNILTAMPAIDYVPPPTTWRLQRVVPTVNEVTVITLGPKGHPPVAILKLPQTDCATESLRRQSMVLAELHSNQQLGHFRNLLPTLLAEGKISDQPYFVEKMLPGRDALSILFDTMACARFQAAAASIIGEFHQRTASPVTVDEGLLQQWVDEPLRIVKSITGKHMQNQRNGEVIHRLSDELHCALAGRALTLSWIHGDFTPGNILVTPDGASVTGIIDWNQSAPNGLPQLDLMLLLLSTRVLAQRRELGHVIRDLLEYGGWKPHEQALMDEAYLALPGDTMEMRSMVLLTWLRHVAFNLSKSTSYARHWLWVTKNINGVLRYI